MSSIVRRVRRGKKKRRLGKVRMVRREDYADSELDAKVEMIRSLVPLGLLHVQEVLDEEITALAGERYARKEAAVRCVCSLSRFRWRAAVLLNHSCV